MMIPSKKKCSFLYVHSFPIIPEPSIKLTTAHNITKLMFEDGTMKGATLSELFFKFLLSKKMQQLGGVQMENDTVLGNFGFHMWVRKTSLPPLIHRNNTC
eukprot:1662840-Amphidinium_carterae.1